MNTKTVLLALGLLLAAGAVGLTAADAFHFALSKSAPAADASVTAPAEVRLWFTQVPQANSVSIRVVSAGGMAVATEEPSADPEDALAYFVKPAAPLSAGPYTVSWRGIGDDGHVVRGEFGFAVTAQ